MKTPKSPEHVIEELLSNEPFAEIEAGLTVHFAKLHAEQASRQAREAKKEPPVSIPASVEEQPKPRKSRARKPRVQVPPKPR